MIREKKYDLDDRLIDFAVSILEFVERLPNTKSAIHLGGQLLRSGTSPSLNCSYFKKIALLISNFFCSIVLTSYT
jgi:hypothetical protein